MLPWRLLTAEKPGWIGLATILELVWAMSKKMRHAKRVVCNALYRLLILDTIVMEQDATVASAVQRIRVSPRRLCRLSDRRFGPGRRLRKRPSRSTRLRRAMQAWNCSRSALRRFFDVVQDELLTQILKTQTRAPPGKARVVKRSGYWASRV